MTDESQRLTPREVTIIERVASGFRNDRIADSANISTDTVKTHLRRIFRKLGVHSREHAVGRAYRLGFLKVDAPELDPRAVESRHEKAQRMIREPSGPLDPEDLETRHVRAQRMIRQRGI